MKSACLCIDGLDTATKASMVGLLGQHFERVTPDVFEADLIDKTHAVVLFDEQGELAGFSTFAVYTAMGPSGEPATIVCSGDTIVAPSARRSSMLPSAWIQSVHELHGQTENTGLYWLLITSGYRTYRFLPVFVKAYCPGVGQNSTNDITRCMDRLAAERWGEQYDPEAGVVRLAHAQPLHPHLSEVPEGRQADPHIAFFLKKNPGHADGDELVSLACLDASNLTRAGLRMLHAKPAAVSRRGAHA